MTRKRKRAKVTEGATPAEKIVTRLMGEGFRPGPRMHPDVVEFLKDYAAPDPRARLRVHLFFDKPHPGGQTRLANVVFSSQLTVAPRAAEFPAGLAPDVERELSEVLIDLELFCGIPVRPLAVRTCQRCKSPAEDYFVVNDHAICYRCVHGEAGE